MTDVVSYTYPRQLKRHQKLLYKLIFKAFDFGGFKKIIRIKKNKMSYLLVPNENAIHFISKFLRIKIFFCKPAVWRVLIGKKMRCYFICACNVIYCKLASGFVKGKTVLECKKCSDLHKRCFIGRKKLFQYAKNDALKNAVIRLFKLRPLNITKPPKYMKKLFRKDKIRSYNTCIKT